MEETHEVRYRADNDNAADSRECGECREEQENANQEEDATCYVLMNSVRYGTEVWPCSGVEEAVTTLCHLARSAEQRRQTDGIQRYFCIKGSDLPAQEAGAERDPVSPVLPDAEALTLTLHLPHTCHCPMAHAAHEQDMREVVRLLCEEDEAQERAFLTTANAPSREVEA